MMKFPVSAPFFLIWLLQKSFGKKKSPNNVDDLISEELENDK